MTIIALDSSGTTATVAIARDGRLLAEYTVDNGMTHSQTMLPMLDAITRQLDLKMEEVDAVAVAGGPGSFTGLRIGCATAKGSRSYRFRPSKHWLLMSMERMSWCAR